MMTGTLGVDTSNYTTSAAVFTSEQTAPIAVGRLLEVTSGRGLRQSDAVFAHIRNLPDVLPAAVAQFDGELIAVGVSDRPRDVEGSYMPCFLAGVSAATAAASVLRVPLYRFSHQANHIAAAAYGAGKPELLNAPFLAWHLSGGTSELLLVQPDDERIIRCERIGGTSDLAAGQAIDRAGVLLGMQFPCGRALDTLSLQTDSPLPPAKLAVKGIEMSLSGLENKTQQLVQAGEQPERIARFVLESVLSCVARVTACALERFGSMPVLCAGGVMCNTLIRAAMTKSFAAAFAPAVYSADNASGSAILAALKHQRQKGNA